MPHYHIIVRDKRKTEFESVVILYARSIRSAFGAFRKLCKATPKEYSIDQKKQYHIYPINHSRFWDHKKGKWKIDSFFGNHDSVPYKNKMQKRMNEYFKKKKYPFVNKKDTNE